MPKHQTYSVNDLSKLASVSIRTLHHYDEIGLLVPNRNPQNGYREYSYEHLILLQQILIYRELEFSTRNIKDLLFAQDHDLLDTLKSQKTLLLSRKDNIQSLIDKLDESIRSLESGTTVETLCEGIPKDKIESWNALVIEKHGQDFFEESMQRIQEQDPTEVEQLKKLSKKIGEELASNLHNAVDSPEMKAIASKQIEWMKHLSSLSDQHQDLPLYDSVVKFATSLSNVPQLIALYDIHGEGCAKHLSEALLDFAKNNLS